MKATNMIKKVQIKKSIWLSVLLVSIVFFFGCYEFTTINQPTEAHTNSMFTVDLVAHEDDLDNDYTVPDMQNIGLFGVLIPDGWTVEDNIAFNIVSAESAFDSEGNLIVAPEDYSNDGFLIYDAGQSEMLEDSIGSPPNYHWWGAVTAEDADMSFFDSLYFSVNINTDDQVGTFYLQYAIGDVDYFDRQPNDDVSDPLPITVTNPPAVNVFDGIELSVYPNPVVENLTISFSNYHQQDIQYQIIDFKGSNIQNGNLLQSETQINLSHLTSGNYILKMSYNNQFHTEKLVIQ